MHSIPRHAAVNGKVKWVGKIDAEIDDENDVLGQVVVHELAGAGRDRVEGGDDHQRDLDRQEDSDDHDEHHGRVVGFSLSLVVSAASGEEVSVNPPLE